MALTKEDMDALASLIDARIAASLPVTAEAAGPVTVADKPASIVSPFATATAAASGPIADAKRLYPNDARSQRIYLAGLMLPGLSCTVDTVNEDGEPTALHGYNTAHKSGDPCTGVFGLPKGTACSGTVR